MTVLFFFGLNLPFFFGFHLLKSFYFIFVSSVVWQQISSNLTTNEIIIIKISLSLIMSTRWFLFRDCHLFIWCLLVLIVFFFGDINYQQEVKNRIKSKIYDQFVPYHTYLLFVHCVCFVPIWNRNLNFYFVFKIITNTINYHSCCCGVIFNLQLILTFEHSQRSNIISKQQHNGINVFLCWFF